MGGDKIEKITIMVLKVDLQCSSCFKKVKKVLCKFPQIRDQVYDEKANTVTIKVFCCNPEKIRDKLCYKGGGVIKSIEIKEPPKPKEPVKPKPLKPENPDKLEARVEDKPNPNKPKPSEPENPAIVKARVEDKPNPNKPKPSEPENPDKLEARVEDKPNPNKPKPENHIVSEKPKKLEEVAKPMPAPAPAPVAPPPQPQPQLIVMQIQGYPPRCDECYQGYSGGPCYHHERPIQLAPCYSYGYGPGPVPYGLPRGCYVSKCDECNSGGSCSHHDSCRRPPPCCDECNSGGPCSHHDSCRRPPPPPPCSLYGYGPPKVCYVNKCDYFSEENASGCSIM